MGVVLGEPVSPAPRDDEPPREAFGRRVLRDLRMLDPRGVAAGDHNSLLALVAIGLISTVGALDDAVLGSVIPLIQADLNFDFRFLLSLQTVVLGLVYALGPFMGYVADRVQRVWMVRIGALVDNLSSVATGLAPTPAVLVATRVTGSLGPAISGPATIPLLADYFPVERRARVFGFVHMLRVFWGIALSLFVILSVYVWGIPWRILLVTTGLLTTVVAFATFWLREPVRGGIDRRSSGLDATAAAKEQRPIGWAEAWRAAGSIGTLRRLWYAAPFTTLAQTGTASFLFFVIQDKASAGSGLTSSSFQRLLPAFAVLLPSIVGIGLTPVAVSLADRMIRHRPGRIMVYAGLAQFMSAGILVVILVSPSPIPAAVLFPFGLALTGLLAPALGTLVSSVVPARIRGQGAQTVQPWQLLGLVFLPVLGSIADAQGVTVAALVVVPLTLVAGVIQLSAASFVDADIRAAIAASRADDESRASRAAGVNKMVVCRDVDVTYDGTQVLFGVDFDVTEGEIVAVLGTNGAGKSTLLRAIAGIQQASNGAVFLDGEDITHKPPHLNARDGVVFLPGGRAIFPTLSVEENLRAAAWLYRDDDEWVRARTAEVLALFPVLVERFATLAGNLSGGEQQMLALGQAFLMKPRLLMIDELSLGLAPSVVERLLEVVRAIRDQGTTVVLVEQSVNVALTVAERAVFMERGRIRFDGPTEQLLARGDLVRAVFLGGTSGAFVASGGAASRRSEVPGVAIAVEDVSVSYGGVRALTKVSFEVDSGEIVGIIGPNGAGKTTLFDVISGFTRGAEGRVLIGGADASELSPDGRARLGLARSFQDARLFASLSVRENVAVALEQRLDATNPVLAAAWAPNLRRAERRAFRRVDNLLELLNLGPFAEKFVEELSTGSRRMVDIACMLAVEPAVLLLDEPSSGLAQAEVEVLGPAIERVARETGAGVLVIEHDMPLIAAMSDRIVAMELGAVVTVGTPDEVMADPRVVSSYLAASASVIGRSGQRLPTTLADFGVGKSR